MLIITKLILAHILGDFLLQPKSFVQEKEQKKAASFKLYLHVIIHAALILLFMWDLSFWLFAALIALTHLMIDLLKLYFQREDNRIKWFVVDQVLHILVLVVLWYIWFEPDVNLLAFWQTTTVWVYITAVLFLTIPSGVIIQVLLAGWSTKLSDGQDESLSNAGKYIGMLERMFVFLFVVTGHWEPVGFLLAAKSVFRFGDLKESKDRKLTEYILIGTLLSFGVAIITGLLVLKIA